MIDSEQSLLRPVRLKGFHEGGSHAGGTRGGGA